LDRRILTDAQWQAIEPHSLGKVSDPDKVNVNTP